MQRVELKKVVSTQCMLVKPLHESLAEAQLARIRGGLHAEVFAESRGVQDVLWHIAFQNSVVVHLLDLIRGQHVQFLALFAVESARNCVTANGE